MKNLTHSMEVIALAALLALAVPSSFAKEDAEPKFAFEWGGAYALPSGVSQLVVQPGPDATIDIAFVPVADASPEAFDAAVAAAVGVFTATPRPVAPGDEIVPGSQFLQLQVEGESEMRFPVRVPGDGEYALFTQHFADEFQTTFVVEREKVFPRIARNFRDRFGQIVIMPAAGQAFGVKTQSVSTTTLLGSLTAPARVAFDAERIAHLGSAVRGRVAKLPFRTGETVRKGDVLIVVDSPELGGLQSDYLRLRTMVATSTPVADLARAAAERAKSLFDEGQSVSLTEVQKRQSEYQSAESERLNALASMSDARNHLLLLGMTESEIDDLAKTDRVSPEYSVRAPIDGVVIRRDITLGALVNPERESLMVVADTSTLWVFVDVPESRLMEVAVGAKARVAVPAIPGRTFDGIVSHISADVNEATRTAEARIEVDNAESLLRPGMFAQAEIFDHRGGAAPSNGQAGVLAVPQSAIQRIEGKPVVFVPFREKPNTYLKRPVTIGEAVGGMLPVAYGLREGEEIVVAGTFILKAELGKSNAKHSH